MKVSLNITFANAETMCGAYQIEINEVIIRNIDVNDEEQSISAFGVFENAATPSEDSINDVEEVNFRFTLSGFAEYEEIKSAYIDQSPFDHKGRFTIGTFFIRPEQRIIALDLNHVLLQSEDFWDVEGNEITYTSTFQH